MMYGVHLSICSHILKRASISKSPGMYWMYWDVLGCITHVLDFFLDVLTSQYIMDVF